MVKVRKGSQKGKMKLTRGGKKRARKLARVSSSRVQAKGVAEKIVRSHWDENASRIENYRALGLCSAVNSLHANKGKKKVEETEAIRDLRKAAEVGERPARNWAFKGDCDVMEKLVAKYGDDFEAMARDIKINYFQWTPKQLERKARQVRTAEQQAQKVQVEKM